MLLRDPSEAEDAAQQTFLSAYRSLLAGGEPRYPAAWLATIARNECWGRTEQRMRQPIGEPVAEEAAATTPGPLELAIRNADLAALLAAIGELPKQQRDALLMREFSGLSYRELAQALAVSEPAVGSLLVRARRELRLRLQPAYAACLAPLLFVRDLFSRLGEGDSSLGAAAKLASLPLAAKLAVSVATIGLAGGAGVGADRELVGAGSAETPPPAAMRSARVVGAGIVDAPRGRAAQPQAMAGAKPQENDEHGSAGTAPSVGEAGRSDDKGGGSRSGGDPGSDSGDSPASMPAAGGHGPTSRDDGPGDAGSSTDPGSAAAAPGDDADPVSPPESAGDGTAPPTDPAADESEPRSEDDAVPDDSEAEASDEEPSEAPEPDDD